MRKQGSIVARGTNNSSAFFFETKTVSNVENKLQAVPGIWHEPLLLEEAIQPMPSNCTEAGQVARPLTVAA